MNWNKYPFLRLVIALSTGIALHEYVGTASLGKRGLFVVLLVLFAVLTTLHIMLKSFKFRWIHGIVAILVFAFVGYFRARLQREVASVGECNRMMENGWCLARLEEPPVERDKTIKVILDLEGFKNGDGVKCADGKLMAYLEKSDDALRLAYGDLIAFRVPIEEVASPKNPGEFDYKRYLERRRVTGVVYLKEGDWVQTGVWRRNALFSFAYRIRGMMMEAMKQCGVTGDEFAVGAAILLGYDDSLPVQLRHNYVAAGSMHILCVSGMHVGIIYLLASTLFSLLGRGKSAMLVRRILLLVLIWLYALVTGLSPSIMRSALMISMILLGEILHRKGFTMNTIAASAFVLLMVDPNNLFAIGFQLSYGAVVGIVLLQKPLFNRIYVKNKLIGKIWEITTVSLAAQIATMPFAIYYFNQFTPYFWLSNLLMTPLSFVVILAGMLLLAFSWIPGLNVFMGKMVWLCLHVMNGVVAGIERLPLSLVKGLSMNDFQFGVSLGLLLLLWLFVNLRKKRMLMELLLLMAVLSVSLAWRSQRASQQAAITLYSMRNHTVLVVAQGFNSVMLCDEGLLSDPSSIDYSLKGHWAGTQLPMNPPCYTLDEDFNCKLAMKKGCLLSAQGVLLAIWDPSDAVHGRPRIRVDYLLVRGRQRPNLKDVLDTYLVGNLLVDGSVPRYYAEQWINQATEMGLPCVDIGEGSLSISNKN